MFIRARKKYALTGNGSNAIPSVGFEYNFGFLTLFSSIRFFFFLKKTIKIIERKRIE